MLQKLYVTRAPYNGQIPAITPEVARQITRTWAPYRKLYHDKETTGENPILNTLLLDAWWPGDENQPRICIDARTVNPAEVIDNSDVEGKIIVAYNADFEARWNIWYGLTSGEYSCPLVNSRTILSGAKNLKFDIKSELLRRKIEPPAEMDKAIRSEFINNPNIQIEDKHINYNLSDIDKLPELEQKQQVHIDRLGLNFLIHNLRSPLIKILAECELTGFVHNRDLWMEIAEYRKQISGEIKRWLNSYVEAKGLDILKINPTVADEIQRQDNKQTRLTTRLEKVKSELARLEQANKTHLKAYQLHRETEQKVEAELQEPVKVIERSINWGSPKQVLTTFQELHLSPLPMAQDKKTRRPKAGVGKAARTNWFAENEQHQYRDFMKKFDEFKNIEHNIKSFGEEWIRKYTNPITGKVHTLFRQTGTRTGRFASGDVDKGYYNSQQIPKWTANFDPEHKEYINHTFHYLPSWVEALTAKTRRQLALYRMCFGTEPGRSIITLDYIGCEIVCMISLSKDLELKKISELDDQHSYMGTKCWRAIYRKRYEKTKDPKWLELAETFEMQKGKERDKFKQSGVFPVIYGVKENKVASIQGFSKDEGKIFIETIEGEMPNVVTFVKSNAAFALRNGYVIHNTRTNSRRWFTEVMEANQRGEELSNNAAALIETAARNSPIQGTNVDVIIEALVTIKRWIRLYRQDVRLLGQVHDELVYDAPDEIAELIMGKLAELMRRAAQRYLIPEISMNVDTHLGKTWWK